MKKYFNFIVLLMFSVAMFGQTETKTLASGDAAGGWEIKKSISPNLTYVYFNYYYQNMRYSYIVDLGSVHFTEKKDLEKFIYVIRELASKEKGTDISYDIYKNTIYIRGNPNQIWLRDNNDAYTILTKKQALNLADEIEKSIDLMLDEQFKSI
jgi:hypothetical protein